MRYLRFIVFALVLATTGLAPATRAALESPSAAQGDFLVLDGLNGPGDGIINRGELITLVTRWRNTSPGNVYYRYLSVTLTCVPNLPGGGDCVYYDIGNTNWNGGVGNTQEAVIGAIAPGSCGRSRHTFIVATGLPNCNSGRPFRFTIVGEQRIGSTGNWTAFAPPPIDYTPGDGNSPPGCVNNNSTTIVADMPAEVCRIQPAESDFGADVMVKWWPVHATRPSDMNEVDEYHLYDGTYGIQPRYDHVAISFAVGFCGLGDRVECTGPPPPGGYDLFCTMVPCPCTEPGSCSTMAFFRRALAPYMPGIRSYFVTAKLNRFAQPVPGRNVGAEGTVGTHYPTIPPVATEYPYGGGTCPSVDLMPCQ